MKQARKSIKGPSRSLSRGRRDSRTTSRFDVVTIGAATRDVFVRSKHLERRNDVRAPDGFDTCLPMGAKIPVDELVFETGGGGTNAAVTFSRFGLKTACVTRVGDDLGGHEIKDQLKREKINTSAVQVDKKDKTAYSIILLSGHGSRAILVSRGASSNLDAKSIPWKKLDAEWIYLTSVAGNSKALDEIFRHARTSRKHIAWNPGNGEIELGFKKLLPHLMQTDILILNREEAAALADTSSRDLNGILKMLGALPRLCLIVTDGANGAYVNARGTAWSAHALDGKVINTTGAGDAFGSAFTATVIMTGDLVMALKAGTRNSFGVVTHMGAKAGILKSFPSSKEVSKVKVKQLP
ncbi:MAG: carbohydrate kinase family protein [Patescibacteria group bacterium]